MGRCDCATAERLIACEQDTATERLIEFDHSAAERLTKCDQDIAE